MAYRAGTAFVAVAPSLRGFQTKIAAEAKKLRPIDVPVNIQVDDGKARAQLDALTRSRDVTINANADTGKARAEIDAVARNRRSTINVNADTGRARAAIAALEGGGGVIRLAVALAPVAAAGAGAAAGALGGLGAVAAGAFGGIAAGAAVGLGYLKQAVDVNKKLKTATQARAAALHGVASAEASLKAAEASADQTGIQGARAVADAERALADARRSAARSIQAAEQSLADARRNAARVAASTGAEIRAAQQAVADANKNVKQTEQDLHRARQQSVADMEAMRAEVHADVLEVEAAVLAARDANSKLVDVENNVFSSSEDIARARLEAAQAEQNLGDARRKGAADSKTLADAEKNGTPAVIAAQQAVKGAIEQRRQAVQQLAQTERQAAQARADAAREVQRAEQGVAQAKADGARSIADAQRNLQRARSDAAAQEKAAAASVARAKQNEAYAQSQLNKAEAARLKLLNSITPGQKRAAAALKVLQHAWHRFLLDLDKPISNALIAGFHAAEAALKPFGRFLRPVMNGLADLFHVFQRFSNSKWAKSFSRVFGVFSGGIIRDAAHGTVNLAKGFGNLLRAFMPLGKDMSKGLVGLTRDFAHWTRGLGKSKAFQDFIAWVRKNGPIFLDVIGKIVKAVVQIGIALAPLGMAMLKIIGHIATWVASFAKAHPTIVRIIAVVAIAVVVVGALVTPIMAVVGAIGFLLSPVGLIIAGIALLVGGIILAYKKVGWFRTAVNWLWKEFKLGVAIVYTKLHPFFVWLVKVIRKDVIPAIEWLWKHVIAPAFRAIGRAIAWAWDHVIKPVFKALWWYISKVLAPVIKWLWQHIVAPAFKGMWIIIKFAWNNVIKPIFQALWKFIHNVLVPIFQFLWNKVVKPVFGWIGDRIKNVWQNVIKPVFGNLKDGIGSVRDTFKRVVGAIGDIWNNLKKLAATPVRFVVNTVLAGLANAANKIPSVHVPVPHVNFAQGGVMPGPDTGRDRHYFVNPATGQRLGLRGREAFMVPEFTDMVGGERGVHALNKRARELRRRGIHHFAGGGIFRPTAGGSYGSLHDQWTGFPALDIHVGTGTPVHSVAPGHVITSQDLTTSYGHWIKIAHAGFQSLYAHLRNRLVGVGRQVAGGQLIGYSDSTGNSTGPHLHFGVHGRSPYPFMHASTNYGSAGSVGGGGGFFGPIFQHIPNPLSAIHLGDWADKVRGMGEWGKTLAGVVPNVGGQAVGWIKDKLTSAFGHIASFAGNTLRVLTDPHGFHGDTSAGIKGYAKSLFGHYGWSGNQFGALDQLWNHESGWNPGANNPSSSAYGIPQGLVQLHHIPRPYWGTKVSDAGGGTYAGGDPKYQVRWGLNYIKGRYGSPAAAWAHWTPASGYDSGGYIPPGLSTVYNGTGRPEPVLTSAQWGDLQKIADGGSRNDRILNFRDKDGTLIARLEEVAAKAVGSSREFHGTLERAGMSGGGW